MEELIKSSVELRNRIKFHPATIKKNEGVIQFDEIDEAGKLVSQIDDCIKEIYKVVRGSYSKRFPELDVSKPIQFLIIAKVLGNDPSIIKHEKVKDYLSGLLEPRFHILVSMAAPTTRGVKLEPNEIRLITEACSVALDLNDLREKLVGFLELNMKTIAPNLSAIVGASIAAKLIGRAGGLFEFVKKPASNLTTFGTYVSSSNELNTHGQARMGYIYGCDLVQKIPFDNILVRKKAVEWTANKCALAARCDLSKSQPPGKFGRDLRAKIEADIERALEPPPKKEPRALPKPIDRTGKRRGGKRSRKNRERYAQTQLRKEANRIKFNAITEPTSELT